MIKALDEARMNPLTLDLKAGEKTSGVKRSCQSADPNVSLNLQIKLIPRVLLLQAAGVAGVELHSELQDGHRW